MAVIAVAGGLAPNRGAGTPAALIRTLTSTKLRSVLSGKCFIYLLTAVSIMHVAYILKNIVLDEDSEYMILYERCVLFYWMFYVIIVWFYVIIVWFYVQ